MAKLVDEHRIETERSRVTSEATPAMIGAIDLEIGLDELTIARMATSANGIETRGCMLRLVVAILELGRRGRAPVGLMEEDLVDAVLPDVRVLEWRA